MAFATTTFPFSQVFNNSIISDQVGIQVFWILQVTHVSDLWPFSDAYSVNPSSVLRTFVVFSCLVIFSPFLKTQTVQLIKERDWKSNIFFVKEDKFCTIKILSSLSSSCILYLLVSDLAVETSVFFSWYWYLNEAITIPENSLMLG